MQWKDLSAKSDDMFINITLSFFPACKRKDLEMPRTENTGPQETTTCFYWHSEAYSVCYFQGNQTSVQGNAGHHSWTVGTQSFNCGQLFHECTSPVHRQVHWWCGGYGSTTRSWNDVTATTVVNQLLFSAWTLCFLSIDTYLHCMLQHEKVHGHTCTNHIIVTFWRAQDCSVFKN